MDLEEASNRYHECLAEMMALTFDDTLEPLERRLRIAELEHESRKYDFAKDYIPARFRKAPEVSIRSVAYLPE